MLYLNDLVHDNRDEKVEEDGGDVLDPSLVEGHVHGLAGSDLHGKTHVVVQGNEQARQGTRYLEHETHHEDHGNAGHDVRMVLDDELVGQDGRVLG